MYIADSGHHRVRRVNDRTQIISTAAGTGLFGDWGDGGLATDARLSAPISLALDAAGNLYIADRDDHRIRKVDAVTQVISTVAGAHADGGFSGDGGPANEARLSGPTGIALDEAGTLYIVDSGNNRIRRVDADTGVITTVAGTSEAGYSGDGGPPAQARFQGPSGILFDACGNIWISDSGNQVVRRFWVGNAP
jgi:sugar lactone lactonase YvrE